MYSLAYRTEATTFACHLLALLFTSVVSLGLIIHPVSSQAAEGSSWVHSDSQLDLAIDGPGWFVLVDPATFNQYVTRHGSFRLDQFGKIVNAYGFYLLTLDSNGLFSPEYIRSKDPSSFPEPLISPTNLFWTPQGRLQISWSDGSQSNGNQLVLQNFSAPHQLIFWESDLYRFSDLAGPLPSPNKPGENGLGLIVSSALNNEPKPLQIRLLEGIGPIAQDIPVRTSVDTDLAIRGPYMFKVRNPITGDVEYTRAGLFLIDKEGYWITYDRWRLQGIVAPDFDREDDLRASLKDAPLTVNRQAAIGYVEIRAGFQLSVHLTDGSSYVAGWLRPYRAIRLHNEQPNAYGRYSSPSEQTPPAFAGNWVLQGEVESIHLTQQLVALRNQLYFTSQGAIQASDSKTDIAISGKGWFQLRDPLTQKSWATRLGQFIVDTNGFLTTTNGLQLLGYDSSNHTHVGPLHINLTHSFSVARDGTISERTPDGIESVTGQILLQRFAEPFLLTRVPGTALLEGLDAAQPLGVTSAGVNGMGLIEQGALEVDPNFPYPLTPGSPWTTRVEITGEPGTSFTLQWSNDLVAWFDNPPQILISGFEIFTEDYKASTRSRFFRLKH